jgi:hypothetical protein
MYCIHLQNLEKPVLLKGMKKITYAVLALLIILPAFTPWMPHGAVHALHDHQATHHSAKDHGHGHEGHDHRDAETQASNHHPISFDAITYFSDYLHVDLQNPDQVALKAPAPDTHDIDFLAVAVIEPSHRYELASVQSRAPPDWRRLKPENTPLYLSTQRLRI